MFYPTHIVGVHSFFKGFCTSFKRKLHEEEFLYYRLNLFVKEIFQPKRCEGNKKEELYRSQKNSREKYKKLEWIQRQIHKIH